MKLRIILCRENKNKQTKNKYRGNPSWISAVFNICDNLFSVFPVLADPCVYPLNGIEEIADGGVVIESVNKQRDVFAHIHIDIVIS